MNKPKKHKCMFCESVLPERYMRKCMDYLDFQQKWVCKSVTACVNRANKKGH